MNLPRKVSNRGGLTSKSFTFVCPSPYCKECSDNGCDIDVKGSLEAVLGILYCYVFQYVIHNPTCNFLFRCGCTWEWSGGWKDCNIFSQGMVVWLQIVLIDLSNYSGPKCPWCMSRSYISWTTDYLVFALMLLTFFFFFLKR